MRIGLATLAVVAGGFFAARDLAAADPTPVETVTVTVTTASTFQHRGVHWWARRAVQARRDANARARTVRRLRRTQARTWRPVASYALELASAVYGVPISDLRRVSYCESRFDPFAVNGRYRGLFQEGPMFERGPFARFGVYDPIANALTAAYTVSREGWGQWQCR